MTTRTRRPPPWWLVVMVFLLVLWIAITIYYRRGAAGVKFTAAGGTAMSFDRQYDFALFRIDDRAALLVTQDGSMAAVNYGRGSFPFCPLCGTYVPSGSIVNLARYYKDGWIYTDYLGGPFAELYHVPTGEKVDVARPAGSADGDASQLPEYASRGLTFDAAHAITPALVEKEFPALDTINESCVVFNAAFLLLTGLWLIVGLVFVVKGRAVQETVQAGRR